MTQMTNTRTTGSSIRIFAIIFFAAVIYLFLIGRFGGSFIEADTFHQSQFVIAADRNGMLVQSDRPYANGFGFTAISLFLVKITGLPVQVLQTYAYPLIALSLIPVIFVSYRTLLGNTKIALIATFLLYLQGDFIFVTWRGSHEQFTWLFTLLIVFLLLKSMAQKSIATIAMYIVFLYASVFALTTINTFFASSFLLSVSLCLIGNLLYTFIRTRSGVRQETTTSIQKNSRRLFYVTISTFLFIYVFIFYLYPVAGRSLLTLQTLVDKIFVVAGGVEQRFNPYSEFVDTIWPDRNIYLLVSSFSWTIIAVSLPGWLIEIPRLLGMGNRDAYRANRTLLWLFYAASAFQVGLGIFADQTNVLSGNVQVRLFTPFVLFALPIFASVTWRVFSFISRISRILAWSLLYALIAFLIAAGLFKASLEPTIAHKWLYIHPQEIAAGQWVIQHGNTQDPVWSGIDERIIIGVYYYSDLTRNTVVDVDNVIVFQRRNQDVPYFLITDIESHKAVLSYYVLPYLEDDNLIYANNIARFYRVYPTTVFQR